LKKALNLLVAALGCVVALAGTPVSAAETNIDLLKPHINLSDKNSLQRGAQTFVNYCLSCHNASYMRYEHMSRDLGISEELVKENMLFAGDRIGDLMKAAMDPDDAAKWFGKAPPNLSTIARVKSPEYIYTFLKAFYPDSAQRTGWNNAVLPNTAMPHVLFPLQGDQKVDVAEDPDHPGHNVMKTESMGNGSVSPEEYDGVVRDLTNFLVYLAEPAGLKRTKIGVFVMLFLLVLLGLTWLLKREYWRDIH